MTEITISSLLMYHADKQEDQFDNYASTTTRGEMKRPASDHKMDISQISISQTDRESKKVQYVIISIFV